ncbi:MAG TPA: ferritin-like domain-containing protein [Miltoncostaeaceae bacterium]|nr:ferritin-like domain-containing protein [Miltoncostaeaceae bacterium]
MTTSVPNSAIGDQAADPRHAELLQLLEQAYWMEIETVMSYIAASINPDGVRAQEIRESLAADVEEELGHARQFGERIKELYGTVPGSMEFAAHQASLQPPTDATDVAAIIRGVIDAERGAIAHYMRIIELCDGFDHVTQDMAIAILRDEQKHCRLFEGFLREFEGSSARR